MRKQEKKELIDSFGDIAASRVLMEILENDPYRRRKIMKTFQEFNVILYEIVFSTMPIHVRIRTLTAMYREFKTYLEYNVPELAVKTHSLNVLKARFSSGMKFLLDKQKTT